MVCASLLEWDDGKELMAGGSSRVGRLVHTTVGKTLLQRGRGRANGSKVKSREKLKTPNIIPMSFGKPNPSHITPFTRPTQGNKLTDQLTSCTVDYDKMYVSYDGGQGKEQNKGARSKRLFKVDTNIVLILIRSLTTATT